MTSETCKLIIMQVPPDFLIPESDEDEQDPDERVDRKYLIAVLIPVIAVYFLRKSVLYKFCLCVCLQSTQKTSKFRGMMNTMMGTTTTIITWMTRLDVCI